MGLGRGAGGRGAGGRGAGGKGANANFSNLSHLFVVHSKGAAIGSDPVYSSYDSCLPLRGAHLIKDGIRSNSVSSSITIGKSPTQGGSQQTTRHNTDSVLQATSSQSIASVVSLCLGKALAASGTDPIPPASDPRSTLCTRALSLLSNEPGAWDDSPYVVASTSRFPAHSLPLRLASFSLLSEMKGIAKRELDSSFVSNVIPQYNTALTTLCEKIADSSDGSAIWSAWAVIGFLSTDPRGRRLLRESTRLTNVDVAITNIFLAYGRAEVTRRARLRSGKEPPLSAPDAQEDDVPANGVTLAKMAERVAAEGAKLLRAKRKRAAGCGAPPPDVLRYWAAAVTCDHSNVLKTLLTHRASEAKKAANETISQQASTEDVKKHQVLSKIAESNAVSSSLAMSSLVSFTQDSVPTMLTWVARRGCAQSFSSHWGVVRSKEDSCHTVLHACRLAPHNAQQGNGKGHCKISWSTATMAITPDEESTCFLNGALESRSYAAALALADPSNSFAKVAKKRFFDRIRQFAQRVSKDGFSSPKIHGVGRCFLHFCARVVVSDSQIECGSKIAEMAKGMWSRSAPLAGRSRKDVESCALIDSAPVGNAIHKEPFGTPASSIAVGLLVSETLRELRKAKRHRSSPCRVGIGPWTANDPVNDTADEFDRPGPFLIIADVDLEKEKVEEGEREAAKVGISSRSDCCLLPGFGLTLSVCAHRAVRVPEVLSELCTSIGMDRLGPRLKVDVVLQARAVLLASCIQSSFVSSLATSVCAGSMNATIGSAKRIQVADLNTFLHTTVHQCYLTSHSNIPSSFSTTPWCGSYGTGYDIGSSGGIGIKGSSCNSDNRLHGILLISQEQVDEYAREFGKVHYVATSEREYSRIPIQARGIPHNCIPGLHSFLDDVAEAYETSRVLFKLDDDDTVESIQCLPFSPFTCRLPPHISETGDPTFCSRFVNPNDAGAFDGAAFHPDSTLPETSIFREPLFPKPGIINPEDNPFALTSDYAIVFLNCAVAIGEVANCATSLLPGLSFPARLDLLARYIDALHSEEEVRATTSGQQGHHPHQHQPCCLLWAATASVLLNCMYPLSFAVSEPVLLKAYERVCRSCYEAIESQCAEGWDVPIGRALGKGEAEDEARAYWRRFRREAKEISAWTRVASLVEALMEVDGSMDLSVQDYDRISNLVDEAVRNAWLVHSEDGVRPPPPPSPLSSAASPSGVCSFHVCPVFVGRDLPDGGHVDQRGAAFGLKPCGFHQVLSTLLAVRDPRVSVQYYRNEGGVSHLRTSALPDVFTRNNKPRSDKACSPVSIEGDAAAMGTREEKIISTRLQRDAYERNNRVLMPICTGISRPLPVERRDRGDSGTVEFIKHRKREYDRTGVTIQQVAEAEDAFDTACVVHGL